jgi:hypothetical protein
MTMTDNDDPVPPRERPPSDGLGREDARAGAGSSRENRSVSGVLSNGAGVHVAPTDPEVPSAKRRGAVRRHRSLVGLTAVVVVLVSITLMLLYRASLRVGTHGGENQSPAIDGHRSTATAPTSDVVHEGASTHVPPPPPLNTRGNATRGSSSPLPKAAPSATGIIRTPTF